MRYKFRAWDNVADEMLYAGEDTDVIFVIGSAGIECTDVRNGSPSGDGIDSMDHLIYMQWTGLNDSKGNPIYEGDVVTARERSDRATFTGRVHFLNGIYWVDHIGYESYYVKLIQLVNAEYKPIEILGNQFQHPELINS